jgi:hypothetical protein
MPKFPARVHPTLARKANTAVFMRRGPSKSVCTILWNRGRDEFKLGQWPRGRIYERRCDLSPDGKHFIHFAMNGKWSSPLKGSWTAISRALYLAVERHLAQFGFLTPRDVSIIRLDPGSAFKWFRPSVSRIAWDSRQTFTMATFIEGGTIGPLRKER